MQLPIIDPGKVFKINHKNVMVFYHEFELIQLVLYGVLKFNLDGGV